MNNIAQKKSLLIEKFISASKNNNFFRYLDNLLMIKRFDVAVGLSQTEQILTLDSYNIKTTEVIDIIEKFIIKNKINKADLFDIIKISNLTNKRMLDSISQNIYLKLGEKFSDVSRETDLIGFDFSILRALDNFIIKTKIPIIKSKYKKIKKTVLLKILSFNYAEQKNESENVYLCWIDRILISVIQNEFNIYSFIKLYQKILKIIPKELNIYWKILHTINYLCFQPEFCDSKDLRKFKRDLLKQIKEISDCQNINQNLLEKILINVLAQPTIDKENYYYLFESLRKSDKNKFFNLQVIEYLIYINNRQNIFSHRFIREAFFSCFYNLIELEDAIEIKEKELCILIKLLQTDIFSYYYKNDIITKIGNLLYDFGNKKVLSGSKFYKYCDIVDYVFAKNKNIISSDTIKNILKNDIYYKNTYKRFSLCLS